MTDQQRFDLRYWRKEKDEAANDLARAVEMGAYAQYDARRVVVATQKIAAVYLATLCPNCGEISGECSSTCGFDGPTASDAMADGAAHAE